MNDGACERVRTSNEIANSVKPCPSFEQVTVVRQKRRRYTLPHMALDKLPEPTVVHDMSKPGTPWRAHMAGVGGMGIGVVNAILVRAGHKEGYRVIFSDKKGLAIRNGGVYSQITFVSETPISSTTGASPRTTGLRPVPGDVNSGEHVLAQNSFRHGPEARGTGEAFTSADDKSNHHANAGFDHLSSETPSSRNVEGDLPITYPTTGNIPFGRADLLLGIDILEAARAIDPREQFRVASTERTCSRAQHAQAADGLHTAWSQRFRSRKTSRRNLCPQPHGTFVREKSPPALRSSASAASFTPTS